MEEAGLVVVDEPTFDMPVEPGYELPEYAPTLEVPILEEVPVLPTYFCCIVEGLIPPGLFMIFAHLGMCLSATSGA